MDPAEASPRLMGREPRVGRTVEWTPFPFSSFHDKSWYTLCFWPVWPSNSPGPVESWLLSWRDSFSYIKHPWLEQRFASWLSEFEVRRQDGHRFEVVVVSSAPAEFCREFAPSVIRAT